MGTRTPILGLYKPDDRDGDENGKVWTELVNENFDVMDAIATIERQVAATTPSLGFYETATLELTLSQAADLTVLTTDHPAWVRIYGSAAARLEDAARPITTKVTDGRGCFADGITYLPDGLTLNWSEVPTFQNLDTPRTGTAYLAVTSMDPAYSGPINLTLTYRDRGPRAGALQGLQGLDGHTILCLTRDPVATDGKDGDICINTAAWTVFAPKAAGAWPVGVSLVGPPGVGTQGPSGTLSIGTVTTGAAGSAATVTNSGTPEAAVFNFSIPQGEQGNPSPAGNTVLSGTVDPTAADGADGDFWINTATSTLFGPKAAGAWPAGVSLVGPAGSGGGGGLVLLEQHAATNSASLDFTTAISSTYDDYLIEIIGIVPATNGAKPYMLCGTGVGPTWDSTAGHYAYNTFQMSSVGSGINGSQSASSLNMTYNGINTGVSASGSLSGSWKFTTAQQGTLYPRFWGNYSTIYDAGYPSEAGQNAGAYLQTTAITGLRFAMSSGNILSGTIRIYGLVK